VRVSEPAKSYFLLAITKQDTLKQIQWPKSFQNNQLNFTFISLDVKTRHQQHRVLSKKLQNHHLPIKRTDDNKQLKIMEMVKCNKLTIFIMEGKSKKNQQQTKAFFLRFKYVFHFLGHQDLFYSKWSTDCSSLKHKRRDS
jgi:hypothetical protein